MGSKSLTSERPSSKVVLAALTEYIDSPEYSSDLFSGDACRPGQACAAAGCQDCGYTGCRWFRADYLVWWIDGFDAPALVTTSPFGTDRDAAGVIGQGNTTILSGNESFSQDAQSGGRITLGRWLDCEETCGVQLSYTGISEDATTFHADSGTIPILARPFFNVEPGFEGSDSELVAFPGQLVGNISVVSATSFRTFELLYRRALCRNCCFRIDVVGGYRYARLKDELLVSDFKEAISGETGLAVGTTLEEFDRFDTRNRFHGVNLGVLASTERCGWTFEGIFKVGLGNTNSEVTIDGEATVTTPIPGADPDVAVTPAGLLAQQSNIGSFEADEFAVVPEFGLTVSYDLTCRLRASLGYSFIYWSRVARPGDQIDPNLNLSQLSVGGLVGVARPQFPWVVTDVWAQGFNFGLEYRF